MNKKNFLKTLKKQLKKLKSAELKKQLNYYDELLSDMVENGLSEEEAVARFGSPKDIAQEILHDAAPEDYRKKDTIGVILITVSLILLIISCFIHIKTGFSQSISIIGGADGPTSIFIAGKISTPVWFYWLTGGCIFVTILYKIIRH